MSPKRIIIFAIAGGLAYVGLIAGMATFAAHMASF
jgi:hypothetical protein